MSQENVEVVRSAFDAFTRGDIDAVLALCDEEIVITQAPEVPGASPQQHGHDGVLEAFGIWPEQWDDFRIDIVDFIADVGDYVVVRNRQSGRGKQSGVEVDIEFTFLFAVRDGKIAEWRIFMRESEALHAAGMEE
jgi:ketosteroid isomerase-like protein